MAVISDAERARIQEEARDILKTFRAELAAVKVPAEKSVEHGGGYREEGRGTEGSTAFREAMLANAPEHNKDAIIAEKKVWW